jgi:UDP-glucose 4-epimerase
MLLVTGCAGFIGSHIAERLVKLGHSVVGVDNFSDYYPRDMKEKNMENFISDDNFKFIEGDLTELELEGVLKGVDVVFHQAGQGGVRESWGKSFDSYVKSNILSTQLLLEATKGKKIKKFVYASSSSIYGDAKSLPTKEDFLPKPVSPYGVTKLAGESLCYLYFKNYNTPVISLRYFTVYGPRQRPDEAFHKFIDAILRGDGITVYGDGAQTRDFTYISDVVDANLLAMKSDTVGEAINVGGGSRISINEILQLIEKITGKSAKIKRLESQRGDVKHTSADIGKAKGMLGYSPKIGIEDGLKKEVEWLKTLLQG